MNIVIAGGGTGGHLFPALAVAEVLQERGHESVILISEKEIDALATKDRDEFRFEKIPGMGMPKLLSPAIIPFLKMFHESLSRCRALYEKFKPDAVLGMGGFTSTAPIFAARRRRIPSFLHESNAIPGKANRLNAKMVNTVLLGMKECAAFFPRAHCEVTGTPIRKSLSTPISREQALGIFGFQGDRKTLLVMGGSQGAHGLNEAIIKALPLLKELPLQLVHLTGARDESLVTANCRRENFPAFVAAFHRRMEEAYSVADLAIARSGAASLAELAHFGIPAILVPYPAAAEDHQTLNAEVFERAGAAVVLQERDATAEAVAGKVKELVTGEGRLREMSEKCRALAPQNAAERVVETIFKQC